MIQVILMKLQILQNTYFQILFLVVIPNSSNSQFFKTKIATVTWSLTKTGKTLLAICLEIFADFFAFQCLTLA